MWTRLIFTLLVIVGTAGGSLVAQGAVPEVPTLVLPEILYLPTLDEGDKQLTPGTYEVGRITDDSVTLIGSDPIGSQAYRATVVPHDLPVEELTALLVNGEDNSRHLIILMPEGKAWDIVGSNTGIRSRAAELRPFTTAQLSSAITKTQPTVPIGQVVPSAPVTATPLLNERLRALNIVAAPRVSTPAHAPAPAAPPSGSIPPRGPSDPGVYLWLDGIPGDSPDAGHRGWIVVSTVTWETDRSGNQPSRAQPSSVTISKFLDAASPLLSTAGAEGRHIIIGAIDVVGPSEGKPSISVMLNDVVVTHYAMSSTADASSGQERVTLTFARSSWTIADSKGRIKQ